MIEFLNMFLYMQPMMVVWYVPWVALLIWIMGLRSNHHASLLAIFAAGVASIATILGIGIAYFSFIGIPQHTPARPTTVVLLLFMQASTYTFLFNFWVQVCNKRVSKSFSFFSFGANSCIALVLWGIYYGIWGR